MMKATRVTFLLGSVLLLLFVALTHQGVLAKTKYTPCAGGRYIVIGGQLIIGPGTPTIDTVIFGSQTAIASGCSPVSVKPRANKAGTKFTVVWPVCTNVVGKAKLTATIDPTCRTMNGQFRVKKSKVFKKFTAVLSRCGDGIVDQGGGEQCDDQNNVSGDGCSSTCQNESQSTTTLPTRSTTSTTRQTGPTTTTLPNADLTPTALTTTSTSIDAGKQGVSVSWTIKNQGTSGAPQSWYDAVYLSDDDVWSNGDRQLGNFIHQSDLASNATYSTTQQVNIPAVPAGTYYLIVRTDAYTSRTETDEDNNTKALAVTIVTPDLVPTAFSGPASGTADAGKAINVSFTVKNQGTGTAAATWYDYIYLSDDDTLTTQDTYLGYFAHSSNLAKDATYSSTQSVNIPSKAPGTYYLFLASDAVSGQGSVYEGGADDNNTRGPIAIEILAPDLVPTAFTAPGTVDAGKAISVSYTVKNQGTGTAFATWYDYVYLSEDDTLTTQDTYLGYFARGANLAKDATYSSTQSVNIPNKPPGTYYLFFASDAVTGQGSVYEGGADDNNTRGPLTLTITTPDLTPTAFTAPATGDAGKAISVSYTVKNQGNGTAPATWYDYVYLSDDDTLTTQDTYLGYFPRSANLAAGATYSSTQSVNIPNKPPGTYYLFFATDAISGQGSVYEGGVDDNNTRGPVTFTIKTPDLITTAFSSSVGSANKSQQISVTWTTKNQGTGTAYATWYDYVYLSLDNTYSNGDIYVGYFARSIDLAANGTYSSTQQVTIPTNASSGAQFLIMRSDSGNSVYEGGVDDNNDRAIAFTVN